VRGASREAIYSLDTIDGISRERIAELDDGAIGTIRETVLVSLIEGLRSLAERINYLYALISTSEAYYRTTNRPYTE